MRNKSTWLHGLNLAILFAFAMIVLLPISPYFTPILGDDSGIFAYIGKGMLNGQRLYVDLWENKGPLIFFLNAFALSTIPFHPVFGGGLWVLQVLFVLTGVGLSYALLCELFDSRAGFFGTLIWLIAFAALLYPGNFTEIYAIPIQWGLLWLFWRMMGNHHAAYRFMIGVLAALAFLLRANIIAIPVSIVIYLLIYQLTKKEWRNLVRDGLWMLGGFALMILIAGGYFIYINALQEFIGAAILVNFIYIAQEADSTIQIIADIWQRTLPLAMLSLAGIGVALWNNIKGGGLYKGYQKDFMWLVVIAYPLEIYLSTLSGHRYGHYYISALAVSGVLVASLIYIITQLVSERIDQRKWSGYWIDALLFIILLPMLATYANDPLRKFSTTVNYAIQNRSLTIFQYEPDKWELAQFIESETDEGDLVWIWANKASVNFFTGRRTMEPYIFPHALLYPDFVPEDTLEGMLKTLEEEEPIIIDMSWNDSILPSIVADCNVAPIFDAVCRFIDQNYEVTGRLHDGKSRILQWRTLE